MAEIAGGFARGGRGVAEAVDWVGSASLLRHQRRQDRSSEDKDGAERCEDKKVAGAQSQSARPQDGPATMVVSSTTLMPSIGSPAILSRRITAEAAP